MDTHDKKSCFTTEVKMFAARWKMLLVSVDGVWLHNNCTRVEIFYNSTFKFFSDLTLGTGLTLNCSSEQFVMPFEAF